MKRLSKRVAVLSLNGIIANITTLHDSQSLIGLMSFQSPSTLDARLPDGELSHISVSSFLP